MCVCVFSNIHIVNLTILRLSIKRIQKHVNKHCVFCLFLQHNTYTHWFLEFLVRIYNLPDGHGNSRH